MSIVADPTVRIPRSHLELMAAIAQNGKQACLDADWPTAFGLLVQLDGHLRDALAAAAVVDVHPDVAHDYEVLATMDAHEIWQRDFAASHEPGAAERVVARLAILHCPDCGHQMCAGPVEIKDYASDIGARRLVQNVCNGCGHVDEL